MHRSESPPKLYARAAKYRLADRPVIPGDGRPEFVLFFRFPSRWPGMRANIAFITQF